MSGKTNSSRTINTGGGAYVEGIVRTEGGNFVGRDQYNQQGSGSVEDLVKLLAEVRAALPQAGLDDDTCEVVQGDIQVVENQLAKPEPKKALVLPKLESIVKVLGGAVAAGEAVQKLLPMLQQAAGWAQQVLK